MWNMAAKEHIQTRIVSASAVKRVLDIEDVQAKGNTHKLLRSNHPYYRNVAKHLRRETQIIKFKSTFDIWINIGYICEHTFSAMSRIKSHFRARLTGCRKFIVLLLLLSQISQNWSAPDIIRCFINVSRIIYLYISINVII